MFTRFSLIVFFVFLSTSGYAHTGSKHQYLYPDAQWIGGFPVPYSFSNWRPGYKEPDSEHWNHKAESRRRFQRRFPKIVRRLAKEIRIVPFSRRWDASNTSLIIQSGRAFYDQDSETVIGLYEKHKEAIKEAYQAGRTIMIIDANSHDVEALHMLLGEGITHESTNDPLSMAYALRKVNGIPNGTVLASIHSSLSTEDEEYAVAYEAAVNVMLYELTALPLLSATPVDSLNEKADWKSYPVQTFVFTSTSYGIYNTPVDIYALHACEEEKDHYLINTGGDWTPTEAKFQSASVLDGTFSWSKSTDKFSIGWKDGRAYCSAGLATVSPRYGDRRICRYVNYPLSYEIDLLPPTGIKAIQLNSAPSGTQGTATSYSTGFTFSIGGNVSISGAGPSGGINAGASWSNTSSSTVPALLVEAGDTVNEGAFTKYKYCTKGAKLEDCISTIQMRENGCSNDEVGSPQNGQTPDGKLSNVAQTVHWQVSPDSYGDNDSFDINVKFTANIADSTSRLWGGSFECDPSFPRSCNAIGPAGSCNIFGCDCKIKSSSKAKVISLGHTFKVPFPSSNKCPK